MLGANWDQLGAIWGQRAGSRVLHVRFEGRNFRHDLFHCLPEPNRGVNGDVRDVPNLIQIWKLLTYPTPNLLILAARQKDGWGMFFVDILGFCNADSCHSCDRRQRTSWCQGRIIHNPKLNKLLHCQTAVAMAEKWGAKGLKTNPKPKN